MAADITVMHLAAFFYISCWQALKSLGNVTNNRYKVKKKITNHVIPQLRVEMFNLRQYQNLKCLSFPSRILREESIVYCFYWMPAPQALLSVAFAGMTQIRYLFILDILQSCLSTGD